MSIENQVSKVSDKDVQGGSTQGNLNLIDLVHNQPGKSERAIESSMQLPSLTLGADASSSTGWLEKTVDHQSKEKRTSGGDIQEKPNETYEALNTALKDGDQAALQKVLYNVETKEQLQDLKDAAEQFNKEHKVDGVRLSVSGRPGNASLEILEKEHGPSGCGGGDSRTDISLSYDSASATFWTNRGIVQNPERPIEVNSALDNVARQLKGE